MLKWCLVYVTIGNEQSLHFSEQAIRYENYLSTNSIIFSAIYLFLYLFPVNALYLCNFVPKASQNYKMTV